MKFDAEKFMRVVSEGVVLAPRAGLEPATNGLTTELSGNVTTARILAIYD